MALIYFTCPENIPKFFISRASKIYPNLDILLQNIPSGNPVLQQRKKTHFQVEIYFDSHPRSRTTDKALTIRPVDLKDSIEISVENIPVRLHSSCTC
jgi:hypothetical protein